MEENRKLFARKSALKGQSGYARIHSDVFAAMDLEEKDMVELVNAEDKAILVDVSHDKLIPATDVRLGEKDMEKLEVKDGDAVTIRYHKTVGDSVDEMKEKAKEKATELKEKVAKKFKKDEEEKGDD
ncbi:MAG: hypothetical protein QCI82_07855 [Candidatus Thermoplasmatota archaeon]|nr:hypothetical protein [Candidatus Thermoplasmatota archaeon]